MSSTQDRQISHDAALASAGQFGPSVESGQLALQLYVAAVGGQQFAPRSSAGAELPPHSSGIAWSITDATVSDVMTTDVVTVMEGESFMDIVRVLAEHRISAVPVLDTRGVVVGVVSEADLLAAVAACRDAQRRGTPGLLDHRFARAELDVARTLMTSPAVTVRPEQPLLEAARLAATARVKRLPVVDAVGRVVGIVSRADMIAGFLRDYYRR